MVTQPCLPGKTALLAKMVMLGHEISEFMKFRNLEGGKMVAWWWLSMFIILKGWCLFFFFYSYLLKLFNSLLLMSNLHCLICYLLQKAIFQGTVSFCRYSSWVQPILGRVFHWYWNTEFKQCCTKPSRGRGSCRVRGKLLILIEI